MAFSKILTITGILLNLLASIILIWQYIIPKHYVDDDFIVKMDKETGNYLQKKHLKEQRVNLVGFFVLGLGFLFELLGTII